MTPELPAWLVPFAFGARANLARLDLSPAGGPLLPIAGDDPAEERFHELLNRMNAHAFGGMGMPMWVQLDCGVLPSAFIGFAAHPSSLPASLCHALGVTANDQLVPVAEALAVPTVVPGRWMSVSMASVLPGYGLGWRAKSMCLDAVRAVESIGITQYDNPAIRAHLRLGALEVLTPAVRAHSRPDITFIYRLHRTPLNQALPSLPRPTSWIHHHDLSALHNVPAGSKIVATDAELLGFAGPS
jgi:hypothetical protein